MPKVKFIDKNRQSECWVCGGLGIVEKVNLCKYITCKACEGTGKWKEDFYHLIYTDKKGQKLCFGVDGIK